jgi:hypothetical protein
MVEVRGPTQAVEEGRKVMKPSQNMSVLRLYG